MKAKLNNSYALIAILVVTLSAVYAADEVTLATVNTNVVALVFGKSVSPTEIGLSGSATAKAASKSLLDLIWREVGDRYAKSNNLVATDSECEALEKFLRLGMARNREKQQREISKLDLQLKADNLSKEKRIELERDRKALVSVESTLASGLNAPPETNRHVSRQWVTWHKVDRAAYEQYHGKVASTAFGLYPIEARRKLIEKYMAAGEIRFLDADFETQFWQNYEKGGRFFVEEKQIDFTPYWLKPIPDDPQ